MTDKDGKNQDRKRKLRGKFLFRIPQNASEEQSEKERMQEDTQGEELLNAAMDGDIDRIVQLINDGVDVNYYSPSRRTRAINLAGSGSWTASMELLEAKGIKVLVKDGLGRLPSTLAMEVAEDPRLAQVLMAREIEEAEAAGHEYKDVLTSRVSLDTDPAP